jgi:phosphoribosylformimino-5-aminoimidazole carboxamide ribotide isomerase
MQAFTIYPAIDLREGQVVRLNQGDPEKLVAFDNNPENAALRWIKAGAKWLHIINLDGAFGEDGSHNLSALNRILETIKSSGKNVKIQFGGGLRTFDQIDLVVNSGVQRVILGSAAIKNPRFISKAINIFGSDCICVALDTRNQQIYYHGWTLAASISPINFGKKINDAGVKICIYTNIEKDGMMTGIDVEGTKIFADQTGLQVIASGGFSQLEEIQDIKDAGLQGVIIGKALYEGIIQLEDALKC